jgi:hypothetical protein
LPDNAIILISQFIVSKTNFLLDMVVLFYNPSTQETAQEDCEFEGYIARPCLKNNKQLTFGAGVWLSGRHLPMHDALGLVPCTVKQMNKKKTLAFIYNVAT